MSRNSVKITEVDFTAKLSNAIKKHEDYDADESENPISYQSRYVIVSLNPKVQSDLKKVSFDLENFLSDSEKKYVPKSDFMGLHTSAGGVTFWGFKANGDWEYPIYFILYWDGKTFRAYIPKGNYYNKKNKSAFGNDEDSDAKQGYEYGDYSKKHDFVAMLADIDNRIKIVDK